MQDLETVGSLEESVLSVLDLRALMQIFGKVPSCHLSSPHDPDNLALMPFLALLFYFILLYLLRRFLLDPSSPVPMAQVNIVKVQEKKDIVISDPSLAPENVFYLFLSKWEDNNV
ncbi:hypothetical protein AMTRI_Chr11g97660 [Amborella trichopoda]